MHKDSAKKMQPQNAADIWTNRLRRNHQRRAENVALGRRSMEELIVHKNANTKCVAKWNFQPVERCIKEDKYVPQNTMKRAEVDDENTAKKSLHKKPPKEKATACREN